MPNKLSLEVVMPIYNERGNLPELIRLLDNSLALFRKEFSISYLFIDDGSKDGSLDFLLQLHQSRSDIRIVKLLHNFGHGAALTCGISHSRGDLAVFMDADLQDSPSAIPLLLEKWKLTKKTVVAERGGRQERLRIFFKSFYFLLHKLSKTIPPISFGTFCILDRTVIQHMNQVKERIRYFPGLVSYCSSGIESVVIDRDSRFSGKSRVGFFGLIHLAMTAFLSFSSFPIRMISLLGVISSSLAFFLGCYILYQKLFTDHAIVGWASTMTSIAFGTGLELLCLGLIGEYIARIYEEVKARPMFLIENTYELPRSTSLNSSTATPDHMAA